MEIAVIAVIALIVLGPQKLPEAARSLGKGFREMRDSFSGVADGRETLDEYPDEDDEEFGDELDEDEEPELESVEDEPSDRTPDQPEDHQKEAESSVPSASSSSTERE